MLNVTNLSTLNIAVSNAVSTPIVVACHSSASVPPTASCSSTTKLAAWTPREVGRVGGLAASYT